MRIIDYQALSYDLIEPRCGYWSQGLFATTLHSIRELTLVPNVTFVIPLGIGLDEIISHGTVSLADLGSRTAQIKLLLMNKELHAILTLDTSNNPINISIGQELLTIYHPNYYQFIPKY